ncbi:MFS transporter [Kitasatospora atroaurantiaca]|uniref:Putative MFS family arabinose efflux permease n=1 Tax=Kitasatospora atroaurantiaca TaxID=285545 RepID=A0A561EML5_9ACTN|nr:MFS transporter [Kitasatospora atroaurantiaca]TWE16840.1 putative MFS family arabinose efflux permease [Kitasatospora atroaurantiaca]
MTGTVKQQRQRRHGAGGPLRRVQIGNALSAFGSGFTMPYMFVYVDQVRGLGSPAAGMVFTVFALAALAVLPFTGRGIDRYGPRPVLLAGAGLAATGAFAFGHASTTPLLLVSSFLFGAGVTTCQPALATMIVRCSTRATRSRAFALQFTLVNLGMGIGALVGGQIVDVADPASLTRLFTIEALTFLGLAAVTGTARIPGAAPVLLREVGGPTGLRALVADKAMLRLCLLAGLIFFTCYGQFESGVAAFATDTVGTAPSTLGFAIGANALTIVVLQMFVVRITERRRRTTAMAAAGVVWLAAWGMALVAGLIRSETMAATVAIVAIYALFGVGESLLAPTLGPIVADLAPARLLGTYNSGYALVKQIAIAVGPAVGVLLVGSGTWPLYLAAMAGCTLLIVTLALRLRAHLTPAQDNAAVAVPVRLPVPELQTAA